MGKGSVANFFFFTFFNILTMKISSYYQIVFGVLILCFLDHCIEDIVHSIFPTKSQVLLF